LLAPATAPPPLLAIAPPAPAPLEHAPVAVYQSVDSRSSAPQPCLQDVSLEQAVQLNPRYSQLLLVLTQCKQVSGDFAKLERWWDRGVLGPAVIGKGGVKTRVLGSTCLLYQQWACLLSCSSPQHFCLRALRWFTCISLGGR